MSVIAVRVEKNKIIIGSDQQLSRGNSYKEISNKNKPVKLHECNWVIFGAAGVLTESNILKLFLETYEPKKIIDEKSLMDFMNNFKERGKDYWIEKVDNQYIFVVWNKVFNYWDYEVSMVDDFSAIGCGQFLAMACMSTWAWVEQALKATCKYDMFCSEPLIIKTILKKVK